jgi:hypothetical protein
VVHPRRRGLCSPGEGLSQPSSLLPVSLTSS